MSDIHETEQFLMMSDNSDVLRFTKSSKKFLPKENLDTFKKNVKESFARQFLEWGDEPEAHDYALTLDYYIEKSIDRHQWVSLNVKTDNGKTEQLEVYGWMCTR